MKRPSPSLIVALVALFVALSSTAIAAGVIITSSSQIKNGVLTLKDFKKADRKKLGGPRGAAGTAGTPGSSGAAAVGAWHYVGTPGEVPFGSTFSNSGSSDPVRFRLEGDVVRLQGYAKSSQGGKWDDFPTRLVFTLPAGFRPSDAEVLLAIPGQNAAEPGHLYIDKDGGLFLSGTTTGFASFAGVTFATS